MEPLRDFFQSTQPNPESANYIECRHCGTSFETLPDECPRCDRVEFATYTLEKDRRDYDCVS